MTAIAYKAFTKDLTCREFRYEVGATYKHEGKVVRCASGGFHSCELSLDVLSYYPPIGSRFAEVEVGGDIDRANDDTKIASAEITIKAELRMPDLIAAAVRWVMGRVAATTGYGAHAATTGYGAHAATTGVGAHAATTGVRAHAATTGDDAHAATTGVRAHAATTGVRAHAATTGYGAHAATTGVRAHAATTGYGAHAATTGDDAHAATTGVRAHAATTGGGAVAASLGPRGQATAGADGAIVCCEYDSDRKLIGIKAAMVGTCGIEKDTWYRLEGGEFVACENGGAA
ncbi:MAG: hypothetical protein II007_13585 [Gammaproteobacteria bacterium]|nr:hypothetical protein [Gammaproteobacteria bacterium]